MTKNQEKKNNFYKPMLLIALPVIIQNLISIGLNMIDSIMIGKLGVDPLAAVGIANRVYFVFSMICFGIYSGSTIFISQYWGVKDINNIKKVHGMNLFLGTIISIIFTILILIIPKQIMMIFTRETYVADLGINYFRIISISYIFTSLSYAISFNSRAIHKLKIPTIISAIAILINTILNYYLIYGIYPFPKLGVEGAAIATVIARIIEFLLMFLYIYKSKNHPLAGNYKELSSWNFSMFKNVLKTSFPVIISESSWAIGTTIYYIAYGIIGPSAIAVVQVAYIINDLFQSMFFGVGNATAVMIGNEIGRNNFDKAYDYSKLFLKITLYLNIIISIGLYFVRWNIVSIYDFDIETSFMLERSLVVFAIYMTPKMFTYIFICGILRAGGDTKFCMILDLITIWIIGVPLSFISVIIFKLPIYLVLAVVFSEEIIKLIIVIKRYLSKCWINNLIS